MVPQSIFLGMYLEICQFSKILHLVQSLGVTLSPFRQALVENWATERIDSDPRSQKVSRPKSNISFLGIL